MDAAEPRVRRRGFFLHSDTTGEPDTGEHENPEGLVVRVRPGRSSHSPRQVANATIRPTSGGRSRIERAHTTEAGYEDSLPQFRSGSVTGSRQLAHSPR